MFWSVPFEHWQQMLPVLDNEILYRARSFACNGAENALNQLALNTRFEDSVLHIDSVLVSTDGDNQLCMARDSNSFHPCLSHRSPYLRNADRAMLVYPAYGIRASSAASKPKSADESLRLLLGESKTAI